MPLEVVQRLTMELRLSDEDDVYTICGPMALGGGNQCLSEFHAFSYSGVPS